SRTALFIDGALALRLRRFPGLSFLLTLAVLVAYVALSRGLSLIAPPGTLNGSIDYLPALAAMLIMLGFVPAPVRPAIALAAGVFCVSLTFRTIDRAICGAFPLGTHFIWHLLNAIVLFALLRSAIWF